MADMQTPASGKRGRKITTPRIDLTPMVDLGFLLITFFMYTTTLARPMVMELQMPYQPPKGTTATEIPGEATLILMPASGHRIAYYHGLEDPGQKTGWCSFTGSNNLRDLLNRERSRVTALPATFSTEAHKLHVLIKPDTSAAYEDIVRTLDEMAIADIPYYTMMCISPEEQMALQKIR